MNQENEAKLTFACCLQGARCFMIYFIFFVFCFLLLTLQRSSEEHYAYCSNFAEGKSEALRHLLACYDDFIHTYTVYGVSPFQRSSLFTFAWLRLDLTNSF